MKKVMLKLGVLMLLLGCFGCEAHKEIDGVTCKKYGSGWMATADFCVTCKDYCLSDFCKACGTKMPLVTGRTKCVDCGHIGYNTDKYCGECGGEKERILIAR